MKYLILREMYYIFSFEYVKLGTCYQEFCGIGASCPALAVSAALAVSQAFPYANADGPGSRDFFYDKPSISTPGVYHER